MHLTLVDAVINTIDNLKNALERAEDIYIDSDETSDKTEVTDIKKDNSKTATE